MRSIRFMTWGVLSLVLFAPLIAVMEYNVCSELVESALEATDDVCINTGRNRACYGHLELEAEPQPGFGPFKFNEVGDTINVAHLSSLRLSPMDVENGIWGVALLRLQADIPDEKPENVNLLLFGDVEVENLAPESVVIDVTMNSTGNVNVRREPENTAFVMGTLAKGQTVTARGRSEDNQWIYVDFPGREDQKGWVQRTLVKSDEDLDTLNVIEPYFTQYGPMQAFYLRTGSNQSTCEEAPNDGLLVQTPEGVAEVRLWINEVKIRLGSTAFIQANPGNQMTIKTLEGAARVEAPGVEQVAVAGTGVTVQLNQSSGAAAPPSKPVAYTASDVQNLPVEQLDRQIVPVIQEEETADASTVVLPPATDEPVAPTSAPVTNTTVPTETSTATITNTTVPTVAPSATDVPATVTNTDVPPTNTAVPPTETEVSPTATSNPSDQQPPPEVSAEPRNPNPTTSSSGTSSVNQGSDTPNPPPDEGATEDPDPGPPNSTSEP